MIDSAVKGLFQGAWELYKTWKAVASTKRELGEALARCTRAIEAFETQCVGRHA